MAVNGQSPAHLSAAKTFATRGFVELPCLSDKGGILQAHQVFGKQRFSEMLDYIQQALVA